MRFLVGAQLPRRLTRVFSAAGLESTHTLDLRDGNRTTDRDLMSFADSHDMIVVTKDGDFVISHLQTSKPGKRLLVSTGNISNAALVRLFTNHLTTVIDAFTSAIFVELTADTLIVHG
jgi:predicted nuclease of predicted toxin-antitoxin system